MDLAGDLAHFYADGDLVTPTVGLPFRAFFGASDVDTFDGAGQAGDYQLRYPETVALAVGAQLTIGAKLYRVVSDPQRIERGDELVVALREVTA